MSDDDLYFSHPQGSVAVIWATYIHGQGLTVRGIGIPSSDPDVFDSWLEHTEQKCSHSKPIILIFQGWFPNTPDKMFMHVTANMHEAADLFRSPKKIRLYGNSEAAPVIPLDPASRDGYGSIHDYNNWVGFNLGLNEREDFSVLSNVSFDGIEEMLKQAAESTNNDDQN